MSIELPIKVADCRARMGVGETYMSGLLRAMGASRPGHKPRFVLLSRVAKFRRDNPDWKLTDVYPKRKVQRTL